MNQIMLRFRPIAPKPAGGEPFAPVPAERERSSKNSRRTKRKYVRVRARQTKRKAGKLTGHLSPTEKSGVEDGSPPAVTTLQLLPERSDHSVKSCDNSNSSAQNTVEDWKIDNNNDEDDDADVDRRTASFGKLGSFTETRIVVECVTDTVIESGVLLALGLGFSDRERIDSLEVDTCPAFVSDGANHVVWVNEAYRRMVGESGGFIVRLVMNEKLPRFCPDFACRVRVIHSTSQGQKWNRTMLCDVWRMDFGGGIGGFAWKLDVHTALRLGI